MYSLTNFFWLCRLIVSIVSSSWNSLNTVQETSNSISYQDSEITSRDFLQWKWNCQIQQEYHRQRVSTIFLKLIFHTLCILKFELYWLILFLSSLIYFDSDFHSFVKLSLSLSLVLTIGLRNLTLSLIRSKINWSLFFDRWYQIDDRLTLCICFVIRYQTRFDEDPSIDDFCLFDLIVVCRSSTNNFCRAEKHWGSNIHFRQFVRFFSFTSLIVLWGFPNEWFIIRILHKYQTLIYQVMSFNKDIVQFRWITNPISTVKRSDVHHFDEIDIINIHHISDENVNRSVKKRFRKMFVSTSKRFTGCVVMSFEFSIQFRIQLKFWNCFCKKLRWRIRNKSVSRSWYHLYIEREERSNEIRLDSSSESRRNVISRCFIFEIQKYMHIFWLHRWSCSRFSNR